MKPSGPMVAGSARVTHRREEQRQEEDRREGETPGHDPPLPPARHEEQKRWEHIEEVAVSHRSAAAIPVVRDDPDVGEGGQEDCDEGEPALARARAHQPIAWCTPTLEGSLSRKVPESFETPPRASSQAFRTRADMNPGLYPSEH